MKTTKSKKKQDYSKDYNKIMNGFQPQAPVPITPQWINPGDFIVKFSLYQEIPNSITSTNTTVTSVI
jgi:hypothetical protein